MSTTNYDKDGDGIVSDNEVRMVELENQDRKADQQRKIVWVALISIILVTMWVLLPPTGLWMFPGVAESRVEVLGELLSWFYIVMGGIIATWFGSQAWISKK